VNNFILSNDYYAKEFAIDLSDSVKYYLLKNCYRNFILTSLSISIFSIISKCPSSFKYNLNATH